MELLENIKTLCSRKDMSVKDLAEKIDMSFSGLYRSLKNDVLKISTLQKISEVLEVPISSFFDSGTTQPIIDNEKAALRIEVENLKEQLEDKRMIIEFLKTASKKPIIATPGKVLQNIISHELTQRVDSGNLWDEIFEPLKEFAVQDWYNEKNPIYKDLPKEQVKKIQNLLDESRKKYITELNNRIPQLPIYEILKKAGLISSDSLNDY